MPREIHALLFIPNNEVVTVCVEIPLVQTLVVSIMAFIASVRKNDVSANSYDRERVVDDSNGIIAMIERVARPNEIKSVVTKTLPQKLAVTPGGPGRGRQAVFA